MQKKELIMIESIIDSQKFSDIERPASESTFLSTSIQDLCSPLIQELSQVLLKNFEQILPALRERVTWIREQKELFRFLAEKSIATESFFENPNSTQINPNSLTIPQESGVSGSYFLLDENKKPLFVIKPNDEDCGCLHNPNGYNTLGLKSPLRYKMPLYKAALKEALTYEIAQEIGVSNITPKTTLAILQSDGFSLLFRPRIVTTSNISEWTKSSFYSTVLPPQLLDIIPKISTAFTLFITNFFAQFFINYLNKKEIFFDSEKLCSVQTFIPNARPLWSIHDPKNNGTETFDPSQFENCNILIWTTHDTDAHGYNILAPPFSTDQNGHTIYGIKKIDNGLTFPIKNGQLRNSLVYYDQGKAPLSPEGKEKIAAIDISSIANKMRLYGIVESIPAMEERLTLLKELAQQDGITLQEINSAMVENFENLVDSYTTST